MEIGIHADRFQTGPDRLSRNSPIRAGNQAKVLIGKLAARLRQKSGFTRTSLSLIAIRSYCETSSMHCRLNTFA